ncbi:MAG: hypothetical protein VB062_06705 [Christensenella sp.]|nr:hypothetical protein [Christensenella sp.]
MKERETMTSRLGRRARKMTVVLVAILLSIVLSTAALADNGKGDGRGQTRTPGVSGQEQKPNGKKPDKGATPAPKGKGHPNGNRPALNTEEIQAAIDALDDTNENKATLTALLAAYEAALDAQRTADTTALSKDELQTLADAVQSAENALLEAARNAEIIGGYGRGQFVEGYAYGKDAFDLEDIAAQIAALDEADANKATLTALLSAYQTALEAERSADRSTLTDAELDALKAVTKAAEDALKAAMEAAGITGETLPSGMPQPLNQQQDGEENQTQVIAENSYAGEEPTGDAFSAFLHWLGALFD